MAEKKETAHESKSGERKPKHKLKSIHTHFTDDGGAVHEHHYEDHRGNPMPPRYGGVSSTMEDLHDHMDDHAGPHMNGEEEEEEQPDSTEPENPQPEGAPNAGTAEPEE